MKNTLALTDKLLNYFVIALAFLMPVFFLPLTSDYFEFNKLALLTLMTSAMLIVWAVKIIINKKVLITRTRLDLPLLILSIVFVLASFFSVNKITSIFGGYARWFPSLYAFFIFVFFYYITASNIAGYIRVARAALGALLLGIFINSVVFILGYFDIAFLKTLTLTGSLTSTAIIAAIAFVLGLALFIETKAFLIKLPLSLMIVVNLMVLLILNITSAWVLLAIGLVALLLTTSLNTIKEQKVDLLIPVFMCVALITAFVAPLSRKLLINADYPKETSLTLTNSWIVTSSTLRDFPLLGTGPSTFGLNYTRYKPLNINETSSWNIRFDKPHNEILNSLASLGILGVVALVLFGSATIRYVLEKRKANSMSNILALGVLLALASFMVTYATILTTFIFFLLLALLVATSTRETVISAISFTAIETIGLVNAADKEIFHYVLAAPLAFIAAVSIFLGYKPYAAEFYSQKAAIALARNDANGAYQMQIKAIQMSPKRDVYQTIHSTTNLALANSIASKENLSDSEKETVQTLLSQAIKSIRLSTEVLNPLNVVNWEVRADLYRSLHAIAQDSDQAAIEAYNAAIQLDPANPELRLGLGGIYYMKGDYLAAGNQYRVATNLKSDHANSWYNLGQALVQLQQYENAKKAFENVQKLVPQDSEDYTKVAAEIETVNGLLSNVAGTQDQRPTVEELENAIQQGEEEKVDETQQPLTTPESTPSQQ